AIAHFGSNDKRVLIGSVIGGVLVLAAVSGLLARRRFALGAALQLVLVGVAAFTALNRPAAEPRDVLPSLATAVAGVGALWLLDRCATAGAAPATDSSGPSAGPSRRGVLIGVGVLAATAAVMGGAGRWIGKYRA